MFHAHSVQSGPVPFFVPELTAWYRHNLGITVTGQGVSQWDDQSGNGNHLLQGTDANRPLPGSLGSELVTNGGFDTDTDWTKGAGWAISGGEATHTPTNGEILEQDIGAEAGKSYFVSLDYTDTASFSTISIGGGDTQILNSTATLSFVIVAGSDHARLQINPASTASCSVDNVSVKEIDFTQGVLFNGVDQFLKTAPFTLNQPTTPYLLSKQVTWADGDTIYDGNTVNSGRLQQITASPQIRIILTASPVGNISPTLDQDNVITTIFNGASSLIQLNEETPVTGDLGAGNMGGFTLGVRGNTSGQFANIQVKEVIIYSAAHDTGTISHIVNGWLARVGQLSI